MLSGRRLPLPLSHSRLAARRSPLTHHDHDHGVRCKTLLPRASSNRPQGARLLHMGNIVSIVRGNNASQPLYDDDDANPNKL